MIDWERCLEKLDEFSRGPCSEPYAALREKTAGSALFFF